MDVPEVEGMEHVGWYQPSRDVGKRFWPKSLTPNDYWTPPVVPLYVPLQPSAASDQEER